MIRPEVTFILPALNEEAAIQRVIEEVQRLKMRADIIVGDSDSTDRTAMIARGLGYRVINEPKRGKGNAIKALIPMVETPYTVMSDCDFTYSLSRVPEMVDLLKLDQADVVLGWRKSRKKGAMKRTNVLGNAMITGIACLLYGARIHDVCTGLWAFKTKYLQQLGVESPAFTLELELYIKSVTNGLTIKEVPIIYRPRLGGRAKFMPLKSSYENVKYLLQSRWA